MWGETRRRPFCFLLFKCVAERLFQKKRVGQQARAAGIDGIQFFDGTQHGGCCHLWESALQVYLGQRQQNARTVDIIVGIQQLFK